VNEGSDDTPADEMVITVAFEDGGDREDHRASRRRRAGGSRHRCEPMQYLAHGTLQVKEGEEWSIRHSQCLRDRDEVLTPPVGGLAERLALRGPRPQVRLHRDAG